jgi:general secretion pathway protein D
VNRMLYSPELKNRAFNPDPGTLKLSPDTSGELLGTCRDNPHRAQKAVRFSMTRGFLSYFSSLADARMLTLRLAPIALFMGASLAPAPANAQSAGSWNKRGQTAEVREDYDAAYEAYKHAHEKSPKDLSTGAGC